MPAKSLKGSAEGKIVRRSAADIPPPTAADLARLRAAMDAPVDTTDIPEAPMDAVRVKRDASGRLPVRPRAPFRDAILAALGRHQMTRYELWKKAQTICPRLPQSAVYEYLRGGRAIGAPYLEALFAAAGLRIATARTHRKTDYKKRTKEKTAKKQATPKRRRAKLAAG
jgi:hypothetical protein